MTNSQAFETSGGLDELVLQAQNSQSAFGQLFDHFYPIIFAYCVRRLLLRAVAEDIASEVFVKVAGRIRSSGFSSADHFRRWLFRIATNEINSHLRKTRRRDEILQEAVRMGSIKSPIDFGDSHDQVEWSEVYSAISKLSDREQSIISLRFFANLTHDQIAEILDIQAGTVRVSLSRALSKLRDRLQSISSGMNSPPETTPGGKTT